MRRVVNRLSRSLGRALSCTATRLRSVLGTRGPAPARGVDAYVHEGLAALDAWLRRSTVGD